MEATDTIAAKIGQKRSPFPVGTERRGCDLIFKLASIFDSFDAQVGTGCTDIGKSAQYPLWLGRSFAFAYKWTLCGES